MHGKLNAAAVLHASARHFIQNHCERDDADEHPLIVLDELEDGKRRADQESEAAPRKRAHAAHEMEIARPRIVGCDTAVEKMLEALTWVCLHLRHSMNDCRIVRDVLTA